MPQNRGKKKSSQQPKTSQETTTAADSKVLGNQLKALKEEEELSYIKCGLKNSGSDNLAPGAQIISEKPVLSIIRKSASVLAGDDLQQWANKFAKLDASTREQIMELDCHDKAASGGALASIIGRKAEHFHKVLSVPDDLTAEDVWELLRIVECNAIEIGMKGGGALSMLTLTCSQLKHNSSPNALVGLGDKPGMLDVRALRTISPGEEITVSYVSEDVLLGPVCELKSQLLKRWQFVCNDERCTKPDLSRAFKCPKVSCKGLMYASAAGDGIEACECCGKTLSQEVVREFFACETRITTQAPDTLKELTKAAAKLSMANERRDAEAYKSASEHSLELLGKLALMLNKNKQVDPSHYSVAGMARSAASVRSMIGDSFEATGRPEMARKMWTPAAAELKESMDAQSKVVSNLPRDGHVVDLVGLGALYNRLGKQEEARACFEDAKKVLELISWACIPARRAELDAMRQGIEAALGHADGKEMGA